MQFRDENGNETKEAQELMLGERRGSRARFNFTGEPMLYLSPYPRISLKTYIGRKYGPHIRKPDGRPWPISGGAGQ